VIHTYFKLYFICFYDFVVFARLYLFLFSVFVCAVLIFRLSVMFIWFKLKD